MGLTHELFDVAALASDRELLALLGRDLKGVVGHRVRAEVSDNSDADVGWMAAGTPPDGGETAPVLESELDGVGQTVADES